MYAAAIARAAFALARHQLLGFKPIDHSRNPGRPLDQPAGDGESRQPLRLGSAKYPEHVVLLSGNAMRLDGSRQ